MTALSSDLLARLRQRAADPKRRYMTAPDDEALQSLTIEEIQRRYDESPIADGDMFRNMIGHLRANGSSVDRMSFSDVNGNLRATTEPPGARPLEPAPSNDDWDALEDEVGAQIPDDLRSLYTISDGGFGPGFRGLNSVVGILSQCQDYRRRGPDYTGELHYPRSFVPIANEMLDYHYDLDTGRIISSNQNWFNDELEPEDVYDIAYQSLADMMEAWLQRS